MPTAVEPSRFQTRKRLLQVRPLKFFFFFFFFLKIFWFLQAYRHCWRLKLQPPWDAIKLEIAPPSSYSSSLSRSHSFCSLPLCFWWYGFCIFPAKVFFFFGKWSVLLCCFNSATNICFAASTQPLIFALLLSTTNALLSSTSSFCI